IQVTINGTFSLRAAFSSSSTTPSSGLGGTGKRTWNQANIFGFCGYEGWALTWVLTQSGTSVSGTYTMSVTSLDVNGLCPDSVGSKESGSLVQGTLTGSSFTIFTDGGTQFSGTVNGTSISGVGSLGSGGSGSF